jgi:hypothetical protein
MNRKYSMLVAVLSVQLILITAAFYPTPTGAAEAIERIGVTDAQSRCRNCAISLCLRRRPVQENSS